MMGISREDQLKVLIISRSYLPRIRIIVEKIKAYFMFSKSFFFKSCRL
jgi:hypothetical protein